MLFNKVWFVFKHRLGRLTIVLLNDCWLCNVHVEACVVVALVYLHLGWRCLHWAVVELLRDCHTHTLRFVDIIDGTVVCGHGVVRSISESCGLLWVHIHQAVVGHIRVHLRDRLRRKSLLEADRTAHRILGCRCAWRMLGCGGVHDCHRNLLVDSTDLVVVLLR